MASKLCNSVCGVCVCLCVCVCVCDALDRVWSMHAWGVLCVTHMHAQNVNAACVWSVLSAAEAHAVLPPPLIP